MTIDEYLAVHPYQESPEEKEEREERERTYQEEVEEQAKAREILAATLQDLEAGRRPQAVLYALLPAVGILSGDREWQQRARELMEDHYIAEDLADESNAAEEERRTARAANEYADKTRKKLRSSLKQCQELEHLLEESLSKLGEVLEPPAEFTET